MFRFWKTAKAVANLFMIYMSWRWYKHGFGLELGVSCIVLNGMWLALTFGQMGYLMRSFVSHLSRLQFHLPLWFGIGLSMTAFFTTHLPLVQALAIVSLLGWLLVYVRYRMSKALYEKQGHGVLPKGIKINPPAAMLPPGAILLMSGMIAETIGESVGHGEIVIPGCGKKWSFSTYMQNGVVLNPLDEVLPRRAKRGITVARIPVQPWTKENCNHSWLAANAMLRQNKEWVVTARARRRKLVGMLPLPAVLNSALIGFLDKKMPISGYDWLGLFLGRSKMNRWTCIGSVQELLWRMGITLDQYFGTGLLGAGTSILDPIVPARFFDLKCYRDLTEADYVAWVAAGSKEVMP